MDRQDITLRVPGQREYALVLRLALSGVAMIKDLDAGSLDDLRNASDEAVDCLLHQGRSVRWLTMTVQDGGDCLTVRLCAEYCGEVSGPVDADETDVTRAVLETLIPQVGIDCAECGCVTAITLTLKKAVAMGA